MTGLPVELLALPPLAIAAGIDLYLTLLFIGAGSATGLWEPPLPGALGDLDPPAVLAMVGAFYVAELVAERFPASALVWNAFHAVIRPVSGALLALLLLDGESLPLIVAGSLAAGALASVAHGVRTGAWVLHGLGEAPGPSRLLVSLAEDAVVLGAVALAIQAPLWGVGVALLVLLGASPFARSLLRAFRYAIVLGIGRVFRTIGPRRWRRAEELPDWAASALANDDGALEHAASSRGCPAAAWRLEGAPRFAIGWIVVRGGRAVFLFRRRRGRVDRVDLAGRRAASVRDRDLFRRVELGADGARSFLFIGSTGPSAESLRAELAGP